MKLSLMRRNTSSGLLNVNGTDFSRSALLMYTTAAFLEPVNALTHQNRWQAREIARLLRTFGFNVDAVEPGDASFNVSKKYDLIIESHPGLTPVAKKCSSQDTIRIAYMTGSDHEYSNRAERERLESVQQRIDRRLKPRRYVAPLDPALMKSYDAVLSIGNEFAASTYSHYGLSHMYRIPNTGYPFLRPLARVRKDKRSFLFLASAGQVYKGLDVVLEVFKQNPDLNLWVCSSFRREGDFCAAYWKELFLRGNIRPVGFIDIAGPRFARIASECAFAILPSCAEGICGSLITAMSAGIIPVATEQADLMPGQYVRLRDASPESIECVVRELATADQDWIENFSSAVLQDVESIYTAEAFTQSVRNAIHGTLVRRSGGKDLWPGNEQDLQRVVQTR